ncbi:MAG: type III pantothenate kinase [Candidatus Omnitrophica bacterium]|nr:type III pantothenate kinase [Candidatus Omnitrophota bacterium]MDD5237018.1 type III pantothenate kinase [Candidatus Omnitrophota bacterium]MDD5610434.1 type III pantothenate kinase [Candidatus Omnitrophota bacterium]
MLLAIDIGNTTIACGVFLKGRLLKRVSLPTDTAKSVDHYHHYFKAKFRRIEDTIICSVVPQMTAILARAIKKAFNRRPIIIGRDVFVPIKNLYRDPKQVGQDRLVNAYAGSKLYGTPLVVVDFGTAVTFDAISKKKEYLGGMIAPGLMTSLNALAERTALLPKIKLARPGELIGRDTRQSMLSGAVYGMGCLADGLLLRLRSRLGPSLKVVGTGGDIALIKRFSRRISIQDKDLTLKGLSLIYRHIS